MTKMYRQGDVLLVEIAELPRNLFEKDKVLASGETTGHKHQFRSKQVQVFAEETGQQFVSVNKPAILEHEEHQPLEIPRGNYKVVLQREYNLVSEIRQIID